MATGLGIDIGSESIKAVQVQVSGGRVTVTGAMKLLRTAAPELPPEADGEGQGGEGAEGQGAGQAFIPPTLGQDLHRAGLRRAGTLGVSGRDVLLKYLPAPPMPPEKLKMLLDMEIAGKLTQSKGAGAADGPAVTYDWRILNTPSGLSGDMVIMAGVCKNQLLFSTNALLKDAGVKAECITPACFGLVNAYLKTQTIRAGETVVLVEIGHELLEIAILEEQNLYFARSAPGGGKRFTNSLDKLLQAGPERSAEFKHQRARLYPEGAPLPSKQEQAFQTALREGADMIAAAIRSAVMFCRTQAKLPKLEYHRVIISGGGARLKGLPEYLEKKTGRPVEVLDLYSGLELRKLDAASAHCFEGEVPDMTVALGLAIIDADPSTIHFSLVPESVLKRRVFWRKTVFGAVAGVVLLAGLWLPYQRAGEAAALAEERVTFFDAKTQVARKEIAAFKTQKAKNRAFAATVDYYARQTRLNRVYVELYRSVRAVTPPGVAFTFMGPPDEHIGGNASPGLGSWAVTEQPMLKFVLAGNYDLASYPGQEINKAWETMRSKLLLVPGIAGAELDPTADVDPTLAKAGTKPLRVNIRLQDAEKPLLATRAAGPEGRKQ